MPFLLWARMGPRKCVLGGMHIYPTWRIPLNRPCPAAMQPVVKLLWPLVIIIINAKIVVTLSPKYRRRGTVQNKPNSHILHRCHRCQSFFWISSKCPVWQWRSGRWWWCIPGSRCSHWKCSIAKCDPACWCDMWECSVCVNDRRKNRTYRCGTRHLESSLLSH